MRKSTIPVAAAIVAALCFPAQAAKYTCTFYQNNSPVGQPCSLDSAVSGKTCDYKFSATLTGTCEAQSGDGFNLLACYLADPNKSAKLTGQLKSQGDIARVLAEQPGFVAIAAAIGLGTNWPSNVLVAYRENLTNPVFQAGCT